MTFGRLAVIVLLIYCTVLYLDFACWSILDVVDSRNVGEHWSDVLLSCIDSGIFWTGIFEMPEEYIMVEHAVDRSLSGEQTWCRYVRWEVY